MILFSCDIDVYRICGKPDISIELLKKQTVYSNVNERDQHIQFFWQTMESFNNEQKSAFLRFVWGRSRYILIIIIFIWDIIKSIISDDILDFLPC